jgi:hypothetical protein
MLIPSANQPINAAAVHRDDIKLAHSSIHRLRAALFENKPFNSTT